MFRTFENLIDPFADFEAKTPPKSYWAYMISQLAPFKRVIPWFMFSGLLVAFTEIAVIFYAGRLIDIMEATGPAAFFATHGFELTLFAAFILFLRPAFIMFQRLFLEQTLAGNMQDQVRWRAHKHMLGQSSSFFQNDYAGRLSNRVMQLGAATEDSLYMAFEAIWYFVVYVISATFLLSQIDARLAIPMVIWFVLYSAYTYWVAVRVAVASEKWSAGRSLVTGRVVDAYTNIESVKLFADTEREEAYAKFAMRRHRVRFHRFLRLMTELSLWSNVLNGFLIVAVMGPAVWFWTNDTLTVGAVVAASTLTIRLNGMSGWIMWVSIRLFELSGTIKEGLQSVSVPHGVTDKPAAPALSVPKGEIVFDDVTHHYGRDTGGLEHVSLTVKSGEKIGLVGRSGAGKSTLVNLLLRFRDVEQGRVLIDGQDISEVTQTSLRGQIGMVSQDSSLLHRSIRANILYSRPGATEAQVVEAAKRAEAHDFIATLEDPSGNRGYASQVGERGVKLSGGQRQRIAIARVMLKDAPILVLDEATSALDSEVEAAIQETLYGMMKGKTVPVSYTHLTLPTIYSV